jgi:hypothetical protein
MSPPLPGSRLTHKSYVIFSGTNLTGILRRFVIQLNWKGSNPHLWFTIRLETLWIRTRRLAVVRCCGLVMRLKFVARRSHI